MQDVRRDRTISIEEALAVLDRKSRVVFRCVECGGRVRAHKMGTTHQAAHFEHMVANSKCRLSHSKVE